MKKLILISVVFLAQVTFAAGPEYDKAYVGYQSSQIDGISENLSGISIGASKLFTKNFKGSASYSILSIGSLKANILTLSGSYVHHLSSDMAIEGGANLISVSGDANSDSEIGLFGALTKRVDSNIQLVGGLALLNSNVVISGEFEYFLSKQMGVSAGLAIANSNSTYSVFWNYYL